MGGGRAGAGDTLPEPVGLKRDVERRWPRLSARERALVWLAYVEGYAHRDIARVLGVKDRSVRVLLFRGAAQAGEDSGRGRTDAGGPWMSETMRECPRECGSAGRLAVRGVLGADARRHVADCADCREVVAVATWLQGVAREPT